MSFDALFKLIPNYLGDLLHLLAGPRRFFAGQDLDDRKVLSAAVLFLLNSSVIAYVLRVPVTGEDETYWRTAIVTIVFYMPTAVALGAVAWLGCRMVGGRGGLPGHMTAFAYIAGVNALFLALGQLVAKGVVRLGLPEAQFALYDDYMRALFGAGGDPDDPRYNKLAESQEMLIAMIVLGISYLAIIAWTLIAWRVYADWNRLSTARAYTGFLIFLVGGYGVSRIFDYAEAAVGVTMF